MTASRKHASAARSDGSAIRSLCVVGAVGVLLLGLLLCASAAVCLRTDADTSVLRPCAYACCAFSALATGLIAGKTVGKNAPLSGLLAALPQVLLLLILCLALYKGVGTGFLIACVAIPLCGAAGGLGSVRLRRRRRYR